MNKAEFLKSKEFSDMVERIRGYKSGFEFSLPYYKMTDGQKNALHIVTSHCIKEKLITSMSFNLTLEGDITEERFKRL